MKRSTKFWIIIGLLFSLILNIIVWTNDEYYGINKGTEGQDLLFAFVTFNLDPLLLIFLLIDGIPKFNNFIDNI
jgi:hypothetical protein